jgi:GNAT superfamily N-acetyltransferase
MKLIEVNSPTLAKKFILLNEVLNANTPSYIKPLHKDVEEIFDTNKNKTFRNGTLIRWLLQNDQGEYIGRIAAFTNTKYRSKGDEVPVGGIGFFDCINNQEAANFLLNGAKDWLTQNGMEAMDGPINFGERDKWWGMVVEGFHEPLYNMNFNPAYYVQLFENYGFQPFFYQLCFGMDPQKKLSDKIMERYEQLIKDSNYTAEHIDKKNLDKYANDFTIVYNKAWAGHGGMKQIKVEQIKIMFQKMKQIIDESIIWFAYYDKEPIGMFVNIPDLNKYFKKLNGKFGLLQKLHFLYLQKFKPANKFNGLVFGVVPEFQGKGVDAYLIEVTRQALQIGDKSIYFDYEMQWIGDFNPKMVNIASTLGDSHISRKLCTFRYLFDREKEFKRHPMLG